jgi:Mycothiol maleylpyruvate isomerase N-terminal domain
MQLPVTLARRATPALRILNVILAAQANSPQLAGRPGQIVRASAQCEGPAEATKETAVTAGQLSQALDFTDQLIGAVRDDQRAGPTPCAGWSVRDLVTYVVAGNSLFVGALRGGQPPAAPRALSRRMPAC